MKSLIHFFFSYLIISSFILSPVAQANADSEIASKVAAKLASYKTYNDAVEDLNKTSPAIASELKKYYSSNGILAEKIAPVSVAGNEIIIKAKEAVKIGFSKNGAEVVIGNQKKTFTKNMSVTEMVLKLEEFNKVSSFNFFNLFIGDAHAEIFATGIALLAIIICAILAGVITLVDSHYTNKKADEVLNLCKNSEEASLEDLKKSYNVASNYYKKNCILVNASHLEKECAYLKKAVDCFSDRVEKFKGTDNSSRSIGKEINETPASGKRSLQPKASAQ